MFLLIPIGRKTELVKFPWITLGLIILNIFILLLTEAEDITLVKVYASIIIK